jgi:cell division septation protein DedD
MAPILIDHRDLVKIGLISLLTITFIFISGFITGFQRAASSNQSGTEIVSLPLPEKVIVAAVAIDPHIPEVIPAGEEIDVDQPEMQDKVITSEYVNIGDMSESKHSLIPILDEVPITTIADVKMAEDQGESEKEKDKPSNSTNQSTVITAKEASLTQSFALDSIELEKIKYTIQVGMYGRFANAENMMKMLQSQHFDAYVSEYVNKKNEVLYNVKFGYYADKKTATAALAAYKDSQKGDGYLVRFSFKKTTGIAGVEGMKLLTTIDERDQTILPASSSAISRENVSQLEMSEASSTLSNSQKDIITN